MKLLSLETTCIYAFVNYHDRKIYIGHTVNMGSVLAYHMQKVCSGSHEVDGLVEDRDKLKLEILETGKLDALYMRYKAFLYQQQYIKKKWKMYKLLEPCVLSYHMELGRPSGSGINTLYKAYVFVKLVSGKKVKVSEFDKVEDAYNFMKSVNIEDALKLLNKG